MYINIAYTVHWIEIVFGKVCQLLLSYSLIESHADTHAHALVNTNTCALPKHKHAHTNSILHTHIHAQAHTTSKWRSEIRLLDRSTALLNKSPPMSSVIYGRGGDECDSVPGNSSSHWARIQGRSGFTGLVRFYTDACVTTSCCA